MSESREGGQGWGPNAHVNAGNVTRTGKEPTMTFHVTDTNFSLTREELGLLPALKNMHQKHGYPCPTRCCLIALHVRQYSDPKAAHLVRCRSYHMVLVSQPTEDLLPSPSLGNLCQFGPDLGCSKVMPGWWKSEKLKTRVTTIL